MLGTCVMHGREVFMLLSLLIKTSTSMTSREIFSIWYEPALPLPLCLEYFIFQCFSVCPRFWFTEVLWQVPNSTNQFYPNVDVCSHHLLLPYYSPHISHQFAVSEWEKCPTVSQHHSSKWVWVLRKKSIDYLKILKLSFAVLKCTLTTLPLTWDFENLLVYLP